MLPSKAKYSAAARPAGLPTGNARPQTLEGAPAQPGTCPLLSLRHPKIRAVRSSEALVAACSTGDGAALGALFARFQAPVSRFLSRSLGPSHPDLDDLVQATFLAVMRAAPGFRKDAAVQTWIIGIAVNVARRHRRQEARRQLLASDVQSRVQAERDGPKWGTARSELAATLLPALRALADDLRTVFMMCEMEEIPGAEVARILKLSEGTMWRRLHAARKLLRQALDDDAAAGSGRDSP